jgi:multidrug efflux pump subunit AcrA (membrane-fusion protein)
MSTGIRWTLGLVALLLAQPLTVLAAELETAVAEFVTVPDEILLDGRIEVVNKSTIAAQASGRVAEVRFDIDDFVPEGEVIVRLHVTDLQARPAGEQAEHTIIRAPYNVIVVERHIETGETVQPGTLLMTGVTLDSLRVTTLVPENLIDTLSRFRTTSVILPDTENERVVAKEVTIMPRADTSTQGFEVQLPLPELEKPILPGMPVKVAITAGQAQKLLVPARSIVRRSDVDGIYVIDESSIRFRQVHPGRHYGTVYREIQAGLSAGERVALDPVQAAYRLERLPADTPDPAEDQALAITTIEPAGQMAESATETLSAAASTPAAESADKQAATPEGPSVDTPTQQNGPSEQRAATSAPPQEVRDMTNTWVINLAAHSSESLANRRLAAFRDRGVNAELVRVTVKGKRIIRIRTTGNRSRREASGSVPLLEKRLELEGAWVARYQQGEG